MTTEFFKAMQKPVNAIGNYFKGTPEKVRGQLKTEEKTVEVAKPIEPKEEKQPWITAEKVADVCIKVLAHPIVARVIKGAVNEKIDQFELALMEKSAQVVGDKLLPGEVPAVKIAFLLITGLAKLAKI